jgi:hypothetical protein
MIPHQSVGSLPRPTALIAAFARVESDEPRLDRPYHAAMRDPIHRFVATDACARSPARVAGTTLADEPLGAL